MQHVNISLIRVHEDVPLYKLGRADQLGNIG